MSLFSSSPSNWPSGGGEVGALLRGTSLQASPLGPASGWPASLRTAIDLMLPAEAQMVLFWGPDCIAFYNDAYAPSIGNKHPQALGQPAEQHWRELWHDLHPLLQSVLDTGQTVSAKDRPFQIERHGYLESVYFDISYSALRDAGGAVSGVLCIVSETTERVRNAQALQASEAALRQASERMALALDAGAVCGTWVWDVAGDRVTGDSSFARTFGMDEAALARGVSLSEAKQTIHPDDQAAVGRLIAQALAQGGPYRAEYRVARPEGGWRWLEACGQVTLDEAGRALRFPGVLIDIDVRKQAQGARRQEEIARRKAEDNLAEIHHHFRLAQEAGGIGVFSLDLSNNQLQVSQGFCRLFGLPPVDGLPAAEVEALHAPEDNSRMSSSDTRRRGEAPLMAEYRIRRASDGAFRWLSRRAEYERDASGQPLRMMGVVQDITERRETEAALRKSEAQFRVMAQAMPNQVWTAQPDGRLDWFNEQVLSYTGLTLGMLAGDGWGRVVLPEDLPVAGEAWQAALHSGTPYEIEFRIRRHDGVCRWHLVRALPVRDGGSISRWVGTNTDIDDQKNAQATLARLNTSLEERVAERTRDLDRTWRLSTDLMLVGRLDGRIHAVNPAWTQLLGWSAEELLNQSIFHTIHPPDLAASQAELQRLADGHTTTRFESRLRHRDGSLRTIAWTAVPDDGFVHAVGRDISAERAAAATLAATEDRLRQAQKMEAVGQLTGGIAHDFNNLLQGISGSLEVVKKRFAQGRSAEVPRFVDAAIASAQRAAALTHRLLAFSRRQPLDPKPVRANPLVSSMEDLLRRTLGVSIRLELVLAGGLWLTRCDPNQLESAILNLAINARDAMPDGGRLVIETGNAHLDSSYTEHNRGLVPGQYVCIAVTDTGTGMTPDVIERAFDPFFTTKPIGQGTGLGLSMIYGFARQSEGHCRIYSEVGQGTTVKLYLPRHHGSDNGEACPDAPPPASVPDEGEVVLVVEDEAVVRDLIVEVLAELGYHAIQAGDGPSGLEILLSTQRVDLLVTDIGLPGLNGRQLADAARERRPGLKVLFMTGYAENAAIANGFLEPGMAMITKPFAMDTLAIRLRDMIESSPPRR